MAKINKIVLFDKKIASGKDMNYSLNLNENSVISLDEQEEIDKTFKENVILTGDGKINVSAEALPKLMKTNAKTVKTKIIIEVKDEDKREIEGNIYITQKSVSAMVIDTRDNADNKEKEEACQRTLDHFNAIEKLDIVENQRTKARVIIAKEDKRNKKEALEMATTDALTGEELVKPVVHHDKSKAVYPSKEYLDKNNYKVMNEANHIEGHSRNILDNPNTNWEEKKEIFKKIKEQE